MLTTILFFILIIILLLTFAFFYFRRKWRNQIFYRKNNRRNYGYIYFYRGAGELFNLPLVKIGRTNNVIKRLKSANTSNPFGVWLLAVVRVQSDVYAETLIHKKFAKFRINKNNEWFFYPAVAFYMWCIMDRKLTKHYKRKLKK